RMDVGKPALLTQLFGLLVGFVPDSAVLHDLRTIGSCRVHLGLCSIAGHHYDRLHLVNGGRNGDALRVIPCRRADHAAPSLLSGEMTELVQRSTDFVRS